MIETKLVMKWFIYLKVVRELMTYDYPNEGPYEHTWHYDDERWEGTVYYPANTNGMDTLTTLEVRSYQLYKHTSASHL